VLSSHLISDAALEVNPLVTGWDEQWRPTRLSLAGRSSIDGSPDDVRAAAAHLDERAAGPACATLDAFGVHEFNLPCPAGALSCGRRTLVMGIINATPDSFSDGGKCGDAGAAVEHGLRLAAEGADILDVGGESTRPGAEAVDAAEEIRRTEAVVSELSKQSGVPVSIDTSKAAVAAAAIDAGASIVNDVTALRDPGMAPLVAESGAALVLMHMQGEPRTMQAEPQYGDVMGDIALCLRRALARAAGAGVAPGQVIVDPGIGFGKTLAHNIEIVRRLPVLASLGRPILMGCSRKSMIGRVLGLPVGERLSATIALNILSMAGRASIIRVHDVREAKEAAAMADAVLSAGPETFGDR